MPNKSVHVPHLGRNIVLVPRELMRRQEDGRTLRIPYHLKAIAAAIPTPPASFDGSKGRAIKYPILGNDHYGDCYYADAAHCVQTWTGNVGAAAVFDVDALTRRYLQIAGGDHGLNDATIFKEWKSGIIGPNGPHKILDDMTVDPKDDAAIRLGMWAFCGASWTCSLPDEWISSAGPGRVWDAGRPNPANGHAMHLSGYGPDYYYDETWGIEPPIRLTPAGLKSVDPEVTVQFSLEMFNTVGCAPNGLHYTILAPLWQQLGGAKLPPSPFPPPDIHVCPAGQHWDAAQGKCVDDPPPPPPSPVNELFRKTFVRSVRKGEMISFPAPVTVPKGSLLTCTLPSSTTVEEGEMFD
jgi:hypothetical protein